MKDFAENQDDIKLGQYVSHLTPKQAAKIANLVGKRCVIKCLFDETVVEALWDTGAQVSIISEQFLNDNFPQKKLKNVSELINCPLNVTAANGTQIPYEGWVEIEFKLKHNQETIIVPFLVTNEVMDLPLVVYNVIEECIKSGISGPELACVFSRLSPADVCTLHDFIDSIEETDLCVVKTNKTDQVIKKGQILKVTCRLNHGPIDSAIPVLFEPDGVSKLPTGIVVSEALFTIKTGKSSTVKIDVENVSQHDIILPKRTSLGRIQLVQSITPLDVKLKEPSELSSTVNSVVTNVNITISNEPNIPEHIRKIDLIGLNEEQRQSVLKLLSEEEDSFAKNDDDIGQIPDLNLDIKLTDQTPVQKNYVAVPGPLYPEVKAYIEDLLNRKFIRPSSSPYSSPVVCVRKKDQSLRLCVDFRALNQKTVPDRHPIPRIQETLDNLGGNTWFSVLDQGKAYHQGYVGESSQPLTAFITLWGLYEWVRIPFGLRNAPGAFQSFMENCIRGLRDDVCVPYLDDIIVFSKTFEDHLQNLQKVLRRLREHGVKLKPRKCKLFRKEVNFLGQIVSADGYKLDPDNIKALVHLQNSIPKTLGDVRRLVGLLGYYRRYIKNFSLVAKPIYDLLSMNDKPRSQGKQPCKDTKGNYQLSSKAPIFWTDEHHNIVKTVIDKLISPPIMAYPNFSDAFVLHTDASELGLGAVLYQRQQGKLRVIAYSSCTLTPAEKNYHLHSGKLEFLALKWSICEQFRDYLYYAPSFTVYTGNNPLNYVLTSAKLNATGLRWVSELADFNFTIKYRPGNANQDADTPPRIPVNFEAYMDTCTEEMSPDTRKAVTIAAKLVDQGKVNMVSSLSVDPKVFAIDPFPLPKSSLINSKELLQA